MLFILNNFGAQETVLINVENSSRLDASSSLTSFSVIGGAIKRLLKEYSISGSKTKQRKRSAYTQIQQMLQSRYLQHKIFCSVSMYVLFLFLFLSIECLFYKEGLTFSLEKYNSCYTTQIFAQSKALLYEDAPPPKCQWLACKA